MGDSTSATEKFVYFDGWVQGGNVSIRPFGQGSLMGELGEELGLTNAWTGEVDPAYGLGQTDIEGMTAVGDATFFYTGTEDPDSDVMAELAKNDIWKALPAVVEGNTHAFPPGIWTFGGPRSAQQVLDAYVAQLDRLTRRPDFKCRNRSRRGRLAIRERPADSARAAGRRSGSVPRACSARSGCCCVLAGLLLLVAGWHLTQGTSGVGSVELWALATGDSDATTESTRQILVGSRIPRLAAGIAVGFALGIAGALLQSLTRNSLASPDTLAVTAGSYLAVVAVAAFGLTIPLWASGGVAFVGGLAAAALVLGLSGAGTSTTRMLLAGSAVALALQSATATLLILFSQNTTSLFAWGSGSLSQLGLTAFLYAAPVVRRRHGLGPAAGPSARPDGPG